MMYVPIEKLHELKYICGENTLTTNILMPRRATWNTVCSFGTDQLNTSLKHWSRLRGEQKISLAKPLLLKQTSRVWSIAAWCPDLVKIEARVPVTMASGRWLHSYDKRLLPMPLRSFIWNESLVMLDESVTMEGAAGMACRIFESYLGALSDAHTGEWSTILANLQDQKELHTAVCLRLASKMISRYVDKRTVPKYLRKRGFDYATEMIKEVEMKIFKYIGFQLPLRSAVVEATTLAHNIGLPARSAEVAGLLTDMAELTMPVLVKLVDQAWTAPTPAAVPGNSSLNRPEVKQLQLRELVAGTVLAGGLYLPCDRNKNRTEELSQLARWASVETAFVQCTADSILKIVDSHRIWFDQQFSNKNSAKRRRRRL